MKNAGERKWFRCGAGNRETVRWASTTATLSIALYVSPDKPPLCVSTIFAPDTGLFETAIADPRYEAPSYGENRFVIVEEYKTRGEALAGHNRWVARMTGKELPDRLIDVGSSWESNMCRDCGAQMVFRLLRGGGEQ